MKLNLGAGKDWEKTGWEKLDHNNIFPFKLPNQAWRLPWRNEVFGTVFTSHMIEHISHYKIENTISEINRVMKQGGILRILTPDLEKLCTAYINKDMDKLKHFIREDNCGTNNGIKYNLGAAQVLLGFLYSPGFDNYLINSSRDEIIGGYAHVFCYDYELLNNLLMYYGFKDVQRKDIEDSRIPDHKDLRNTKYDNDKEHSLIIECTKDKYVPFDKNHCLMLNGPYSYSQVVECNHLLLTKLVLVISSRIENYYRFLRRSFGKLLHLRKK